MPKTQNNSDTVISYGSERSGVNEREHSKEGDSKNAFPQGSRSTQNDGS
jgi:hypothetical protein